MKAFLQTSALQEDTNEILDCFWTYQNMFEQIDKTTQPKNHKECRKEVWDNQQIECCLIIKSHVFKEDAMTRKKCSAKMVNEKKLYKIITI